VKKSKSLIVALLAIGLVTSVAVVIFLTTGNTVTARQQMYTGNENHTVTLDQAAHYVQNFTNFRTAPSIKGVYFGRNIFEKILAQSGCVGIRAYYAQKDDATPTLVLVGVNGSGNDLVEGTIGELSFPCPPYCPAPNSLNK